MADTKIKTKAKTSDKDVSATDEVSQNTINTAGFFGMGFGLWGLICFIVGLLAGGMVIGYFKAVSGAW
ncbi:MAG: hypothetical protein OEV91_07395 [Desulfobulbaceae bacterium]|nr:hypothetical protein [Desulfobulbaceae bacterium]